MYEGFFLIVLVTLVVLAIRPGKKVRYDNPLVIHKSGLYHATLAPKLIRAQPFIEAVASQFSGAGLPAGDIATQYFKVSDAAGPYLLAAGFRAGMWYFQAIEPLDADDHYKTLHQFADQVMVHVPIAESLDTRVAEQLRAAVEVAARNLQITCLNLNLNLNAEC